MKSPFAYGKVVEEQAFTNRKSELKKLHSNFDHQIHTILISPRRWGKTSLIQKAVSEYAESRKDARYCMIDLFSVREEREFYEVLAREVIKATSTKVEEWWVVKYINNFA